MRKRVFVGDNDLCMFAVWPRPGTVDSVSRDALPLFDLCQSNVLFRSLGNVRTYLMMAHVSFAFSSYVRGGCGVRRTQLDTWSIIDSQCRRAVSWSSEVASLHLRCLAEPVQERL